MPEIDLRSRAQVRSAHEIESAIDAAGRDARRSRLQPFDFTQGVSGLTGRSPFGLGDAGTEKRVRVERVGIPSQLLEKGRGPTDIPFAVRRRSGLLVRQTNAAEAAA